MAAQSDTAYFFQDFKKLKQVFYFLNVFNHHRSGSVWIIDELDDIGVFIKVYWNTDFDSII